MGKLEAAQRKKILVLMVNMFIAIGSFGIVIPILPDYLQSIGEGGTAAGLMIAVFAGAQFFMSPIAGKWADDYGRRKMIISGLSVLALSMFVFYLSDHIWILYLSRVIGGIGSALLVPAIFAYIADITTLDQRARGTSYVSAAMSLGIVIGPGIGGFLADWGLKVPFLISAFGTLAAVVFSVVVLKETHQPDLQQQSGNDSEAMIKKMAQSVKKPYFMVLFISLVMSFGLMAYESVIGLFVDDQFGATPQDIAIMVTSTGIVSVIVQLFIVDRIVARFGEWPVLIGFLALAAAGFLFSIFAKAYLLFFAITLIIFLATSILRPVLNTLVSKLAGNEQGFAMGMNNAYMSIGNVLGPVLAGVMYDKSIVYPFMLGFIILLVTTLMTIRWQGRNRTVHAKNRTAQQEGNQRG